MFIQPYIYENVYVCCVIAFVILTRAQFGYATAFKMAGHRYYRHLMAWPILVKK